GGSIGITGTLGLVFNNFSLRNMFRFKEWDPLPMGDGQNLSIRFQSSGLWYNSANFSFTEPWLGGKRPNSLTVSGIYSRVAMGAGNMWSGNANPTESYFSTWGGGVSMSSRLSWPDNYFTFSYGLNYQS